MKTILAVAIGGAFGALGRHVVAYHVNQLFSGGFPLGTLSVNVLGSFLMGVLIEVMALFWSPSPELRAFSTFSMEVVLLYERGAHLQMALYVALSVALSVFGLFAGLAVVRAVGS
jgi:CrcB protein